MVCVYEWYLYVSVGPYGKTRRPRKGRLRRQSRTEGDQNNETAEMRPKPTPCALRAGEKQRNRDYAIADAKRQQGKRDTASDYDKNGNPLPTHQRTSPGGGAASPSISIVDVRE